MRLLFARRVCAHLPCLGRADLESKYCEDYETYSVTYLKLLGNQLEVSLIYLRYSLALDFRNASR